MAEIIIYSDGSSINFPGKGAYGVVLMSGVHRKEIYQGYRLTTSPRMELMAAIAGLSALKKEKQNVLLYVDNLNIVKMARSRNKKSKHQDLAQKLFSLLDKHHVRVELTPKDHKTSMIEKKRSTKLAYQAACGNNLLVDEYFEKTGIHEEPNLFKE